MAPPSHNRYALFASSDSNNDAAPSPPEDPAKNPFLNQVADDSIPWEQVKKRNASAKAAPPPPWAPLSRRPVNTAIDRPSSSPHVQKLLDKIDSVFRRTAPQSPTEANEKCSPDPHENWCGVCSLKLPSKTALLTHIKSSANHQHYCNLCKRVFKDRNGLKNHIDNAAGHETYCNLCLSAFKNQWGLKNHFENNLSVGHEHVCMTCLLGFKNKTALHMHLIIADKHTWCASCQCRFRNQEERDEHWLNTKRKSLDTLYI